MKKILAIVLAGVLTLGMSVSVLADTTLTDSGLGSTTGSTDVNARYVPNDSIAATVTWGDMNFIFTENGSTWWADNNSNIVTVTNNSAHKNIQATYSYQSTRTSALDYGVGLFEGNEVSSFAIGSSTTGIKSLAGGTEVTGYILGQQSTNNKEINALMFTGAPNDLGDVTSSEKIGTLTVSIAENDGEATAPNTSSNSINFGG